MGLARAGPSDIAKIPRFWQKGSYFGPFCQRPDLSKLGGGKDAVAVRGARSCGVRCAVGARRAVWAVRGKLWAVGAVGGELWAVRDARCAVCGARSVRGGRWALRGELWAGVARWAVVREGRCGAVL